MPPNVQLEDLFKRLIKNVTECKPDFGKAAGGDACCTPVEGPEEELKGYLPKLNEVILEILQEDADLPSGQHRGDNNTLYNLNAALVIQSICLFA